MADKKNPAAKPVAKKAPAKKPTAKPAAAKKPAAKQTAKPATPKKSAAKPAPKPETPPKVQAETVDIGGGRPVQGTGNKGRIRPTVSHMLGEIVWLLSQSQAHRHFSISDLDWMVAPAIANNQYRVFRAGKKPIGVALWAKVNDEANTRLTSGSGRLRPDEWNSGQHFWLIEVISPFSNAENKLTEAMFNDLVKGPLRGRKFRFSKVNPKTGKREVAEFKPNPGK